jgi:hypothetical protein
MLGVYRYGWSIEKKTILSLESDSRMASDKGGAMSYITVIAVILDISRRPRACLEDYKRMV